MRRLPILLPVLLLAACDSPTGPDRALLGRAALAETRWLEARPAHYLMVQGRGCECLPEMAGPVRARVEQVAHRGPHQVHPAEYIVEARYVATDEPVPAEYLDGFRSVSQLFALIRAAYAAGAASVEAEFDSHYGYPTLVSIDYDLRVADDEFTISIAALWNLDVLADSGP